MRINDVVTFIALLAFIGCAPSIKYKMTGLEKVDNQDLKNLTISIQTFSDIRKNSSYLKDIIFNTTKSNKSECYNFEKNYKKLNVSNKISELLAEHIDSMKIFKTVYFNKKDKANIYLTGNIASFAAHATINQSAKSTQAAGAAFGLIGGLISAAATSGMKSNYDFEIKYSNVAIFDKNGNNIYQIPELQTKDNKEISAVTDCGIVFTLINEDLKNQNSQLIQKIISDFPNALNSRH